MMNYHLKNHSKAMRIIIEIASIRLKNIFSELLNAKRFLQNRKYPALLLPEIKISKYLTQNLFILSKLKKNTTIVLFWMDQTTYLGYSQKKQATLPKVKQKKNLMNHQQITKIRVKIKIHRINSVNLYKY